MSPIREVRHVSVMPGEVLRLLEPGLGETWVDCTIGGGGHARLIAETIGPGGRLIGLDQDPAMLELARVRLTGLPVELLHANFDQLPEVLEDRGLTTVDGVFADLGFASDQVDEAARGLSFRIDGPLDMRLDQTTGMPASDLVNTLSESALADLFYEYGEERQSRRVARAIVERRRTKPFETTTDLADVVRSRVRKSGAIDPATRVFQALRIAVNEELGALDRLLAALPRVVKPGGRVGIISFHSLEDRRVKHAFRVREVWEPATKKPVEAGEAELAQNPRARSAKLRVARRINE
jgi:16S rRNA (cytosine1402-N4)-methyltransferase